MANIREWFGSVSKEGAREFVWSALRSWAWPVLLPGLTAVMGFIDGLPLTYIMVSVFASFAFVTHGLVKLSEWRELRNPEHKLDFAGPYVGKVPKEDNTAELSAIRLGFKMVNNANFPLDIKIEKIRTTFGNRHNPDALLSNTNFTVNANSKFHFVDASIDVSDLTLKNANYKANVEFELHYGVKGKKTFAFGKEFSFPLIFDENGEISVGSTTDKVSA